MNTSSTGSAADQAKTPVNDEPIDSSSRTSSAVPRVVVTCPMCKATLRVRRVYIGNAVQCKQCGQIFMVPLDVDAEPLPVVNHAARDLPRRTPPADFDLVSQQAASAESALFSQLSEYFASTNELRNAHGSLKAEHEDLKRKRDELGARLESVTAELEKIQAHLGQIAAADVPSLASQKQQLTALVETLRDEIQEWQFKDVQRGQQLEQSTADLEAALEERDQLSRQLAGYQNDLGQVRAELDRSEHQRQQALDQVAELTKSLAERDELLSAARAERQQIAAEAAELRANAEETARVAEQLILANLNPPEATLAAPDELEAEFDQAEELDDKLEDANLLYRVMARNLQGVGTPRDAPVPARSEVEIEAEF